MKNLKNITISILGAFCFLFLSFGSSDSKTNSESSCEYASEMEDVKKCAIGTWLSTPSGKLWKRIVLKENGTYELFTATPDRGQWSTSPDYKDIYEIGVSRYSDTGKKYVYISLKNSGIWRFQLVFDGRGATLEYNGNFESISKGDVNPWK